MVPDRDDRRFVHTPVYRAQDVGSGCTRPGKGNSHVLNSELFGLTDNELSELKARHLACSLLIRGCQAAILDYRKKAGNAGEQQARHEQRVIDVLEEVLQAWCETLSVLRSVLNQTSARRALSGRRNETAVAVFTGEPAKRGWASQKMMRGADTRG